MRSNKIIFDENIVGSATGEALILTQDDLLVSALRKYPIVEDIPLPFVEEGGSTPTATIKLLDPDGKVTHEHTISEFMAWFEEAGFSFIPQEGDNNEAFI